MLRNLLYVPTNRCCIDQISQLAREAQLICEHSGPCPIALIEHDDAQWSAQHKEALTKAREQYGVDAIHMTRAGAGVFLADVIGRLGLAEADSARLLALLNPRDLAYGAGPNKAALLAAAAGCRVLYRRDSDVRVDEWPSGLAYPCISESKALGKTIGELGIEDTREHRTTDSICFVGTSSFGNAPHDRRDLLAVDEKYLIELELLAAPDESPEKLLEETRQYLIIDPEIRYTRDFFEVDLTGRTVMLACAMADIFLELPEMPIHRMLGTDYMRRNALRYLGRPIIFHSRKVCHRYDLERASQANLAAVIDYAQRDLRHLIIWPVLCQHHQTMRNRSSELVADQGALNTSAYAANLLNALEDATDTMTGMPEAFAAIYRTAANAASDKARAKRLLQIAEGIDSGPDYIREVVEGIADYVFLIKHWRALIDSAASSNAHEAAYV